MEGWHALLSPLSCCPMSFMESVRSCSVSLLKTPLQSHIISSREIREAVLGWSYPVFEARQPGPRANIPGSEVRLAGFELLSYHRPASESWDPYPCQLRQDMNAQNPDALFSLFTEFLWKLTKKPL